jgi:hypothetical protein
MTSTDFLIFMANQTTGYSIGSWEELRSVTFNMATLTIDLESEEGGEVSVPCDDLAELHRLAQISYGLADGYDVKLEWKIPTIESARGAK